MKNIFTIKTLTTLVCLLAFALNSHAIVRQNVYLYHGSSVVFQTDAALVDSVALESDKTVLSLYSADGTRIYTTAYATIDSMVYVTLPNADLLDATFNEDGTATDVSDAALPIETIKGLGVTTYYNTTYKRYVATFDNEWGGTATGYYKANFEDNQAFKDKLASGHTLECYFMGNYGANLDNVEAKFFAAHEAGGTGFLISKQATGRGNEITFLPNVSTTGKSTWRWATSGIVPENQVYYHIVGVWNKEEKKAYIYVNGELKNTVDADGDFVFGKANANWFGIGCDAGTGGGAQGWKGDVVLARVYSEPLDQNQVTELWNNVAAYKSFEKPALVEGITLETGYQAEVGGNIQFNGTGFVEGDVINLYNPDNDSLIASFNAHIVKDGAFITFEDKLENGIYRVVLSRGEEVQVFGTTTLTFVNTNAKPVADMLDVVFNYDGTATDASEMNNKVEFINNGSASTYYSNTYKRYVAHFENPWAGTATGYYKVDYSQNQTFKNLLANGHTMEAVVMADYEEPIANVEAKFFSSHQSGGTGFLISKISGERQNEFTFLPYTNNNGSKGYRWSNSKVVPTPKVYYHVVGVWNKVDGCADIYVNGELKATVAAQGELVFPSATSNWFAIGADPNGGNANTAWNGDVVLARIYSSALNSDQVSALWDEVKELQDNAVDPLITNVSYDKDYIIKAGSEVEIKGTGFAEGDKIQVVDPKNNNQVLAELPTTLTENGVKVTLPNGVVSGIYILNIHRGDVEEYLTTYNLKVADELPQGSEVIAHRGYWNKQGSAQNSIQSLDDALALDIYGSETDVWITTDGHLMVNHDAALGGVTIQNATYDECKDLELSNGEKIPELKDFLDVLSMSETRTKLIIEIKVHSDSLRNVAAAKAAVAAVAEAEMQDKVEYISFSLDVCKELVKENPNAIVSYLNGDKAPAELKTLGISGLDYTAATFRNHPTWIADAHALGMKVNVWTIDSKSEIIEMNNLGADYITTNAPLDAMEVQKHYQDANVE